jgi:SAM-dependent methyltransferase
VDPDLGADGGCAGGAAARPALNPVDSARFAAEWLALREPADADARAAELIPPLRAHLARVPSSPLVVRDLGCGTGALGRWLAGRLAGPQHWILHDRDPALLERAAEGVGTDSGGRPITRETRLGDVTELRPADLAGTSLVAASALLDLLTADEVERLAEACMAAGCPALLTLSVVGRVELSPGDPLDGEVAAAFDAHQRRTTGGRRLLGPDAGDAAAGAFGRRGAVVHRRPSAWRLDARHAALADAWLRGWVGAAVEQRPDLALPGQDYLRRRRVSWTAGEPAVTVHHVDLLALPAGAG